jgi:hypothetical protein
MKSDSAFDHRPAASFWTPWTGFFPYNVGCRNSGRISHWTDKGFGPKRNTDQPVWKHGLACFKTRINLFRRNFCFLSETKMSFFAHGKTHETFKDFLLWDNWVWKEPEAAASTSALTVIRALKCRVPEHRKWEWNRAPSWRKNADDGFDIQEPILRLQNLYNSTCAVVG